MKIQLANRTYHQLTSCCGNCDLCTFIPTTRNLYDIQCKLHWLIDCQHNGFKRKLFNDKIFKL